MDVAESATRRSTKPAHVERPLLFSDVDDGSSVHLSVDDVLSPLPRGTLGHPEVGDGMRLIQPENAAGRGSRYRARATYPYCNVIAFGVTGMSVETIECAGEDEGMKFVPLVEKKRAGRHVGHSKGKTHYTPKQDT